MTSAKLHFAGFVVVALGADPAGAAIDRETANAT